MAKRWLGAPATPLLLALALLAQASQDAAPKTAAAGVLLDFAVAARGDNADAVKDWHSGTDPCSWSGVICTGQVVTALRLPKAGLRGTLAPELSQLTTLQHINLMGNELSGSLPASWARLGRLERLYLDGNKLSGSLPAAWNTLDSIKYMSLSGNRLSGSLPVAWSSMGQLQLYLLDLSGNQLSSSLPAPWARQRMLFRLGLARNALTGTLPREWSRLGSLLQMDLSGNALTGPLPDSWGALRQATSLDLSGNQLRGSLPPAWADLRSLQMLALHDNQLTGAVPPQWAALADRAYRISLGNNPGLCGAVPPTLASAALAAGSSAKGSGLPKPCSWQADAAALLQLKAAVLAGPQGVLADWLPEANPCSEEAWRGVSCRGGRVVILNLANAGLKFASLESLGSLAALEKLLLAGNTANASLPGSWARLQQLAVADLTGLGLTGTLPPSWSQLRGIKQLLLGGNNLSGNLPTSWAALGNLATINLARNALAGGLPEEWSTMTALSSLDASSNYLAGNLPDSWKALDSLQELQLANNNLAGPIPTSWARLPSLTSLSLSSNVGVCGGQPTWRAGTKVQTEATNVDQSCFMVTTSGAVAGVILGVSLSATLASLVAVAALVVYVRRQRVQLHLLQRERSSASFSAVSGKLATLHTFGAAAADVEYKSPADRFKMLQVPNPWSDDLAGYIQVPIATPHSSVMKEATTPRGNSAPPSQQDHRSPSPVSGMPSPERHQWQVATQAADRGVELTARRSRQKRLFRSRSEAPTTLADELKAAAAAGRQEEQRGRSQDDCDIDMMRVHSRIALLPTDGGMV